MTEPDDETPDETPDDAPDDADETPDYEYCTCDMCVHYCCKEFEGGVCVLFYGHEGPCEVL